MPFTPYHLGPIAVLFALALLLDPVALVLGTVLPDVEPAAQIAFGVGPGHGAFHSFLGAIFVGFSVYLFSRVFWMAIEHKNLPLINILLVSPTHILSLISAMIASFSHVILDASVDASKTDVFWPSGVRFTYTLIPIDDAYVGCIVAFFIASGIFFIRGYLMKKPTHMKLSLR